MTLSMQVSCHFSLPLCRLERIRPEYSRYCCRAATRSHHLQIIQTSQCIQTSRAALSQSAQTWLLYFSLCVIRRMGLSLMHTVPLQDRSSAPPNSVMIEFTPSVFEPGRRRQDDQHFEPLDEAGLAVSLDMEQHGSVCIGMITKACQTQYL